MNDTAYAYAKIAQKERLETAELRRQSLRIRRSRTSRTPIRHWWAALLHRVADRLDPSVGAQPMNRPLTTSRTWCHNV